MQASAKADWTCNAKTNPIESEKNEVSNALFALNAEMSLISEMRIQSIRKT